jgi:hypothetical protein
MSSSPPSPSAARRPSRPQYEPKPVTELLIPRVELDLAALNVAAVNGLASAVLVHFLMGPYRQQSKKSWWMQAAIVALGAFVLNWLVSEFQYSTVRRLYRHCSNSYLVYNGLAIGVACFVYFWLLPQVGVIINAKHSSDSDSDSDK